MNRYREIELTDKPSFDRILNELGPESSDLTFTNLFMWKHNYGLHISYEPELDYWLIFAQPPSPKWKPFFLPPVGDWANREKLHAALELMVATANAADAAFRIRRAPAALVQAIQAAGFPIHQKEERYTYDYLYRTEDLINLSGRKYHSKRNHLNQFQRKYHWEFAKITPEIAAECLEIEQDWFNISKTRELLTDEEWAMATVFRNFEALKVTGGVLRIEGQIAAIAVGERLNQNTAVIHIEKANTEFDGIYVAINQQFAANCWQDWEFINREEDMGLDGLRQSKLSYHPYQLIEKYSIIQA